jgi:hypothetical protein
MWGRCKPMELSLLSVNCGIPRLIGHRSGTAGALRNRKVSCRSGNGPVRQPRHSRQRAGEPLHTRRTRPGGLCLPGRPLGLVARWWRAEVNFDCKAGSFGENLTLLGADEHSVGIGDRFAWGEVVLEITQPRGPCTNVDLHHGCSDIARAMTLSGRCGWYMRVICEGSASARNTPIRHFAMRDGPTQHHKCICGALRFPRAAGAAAARARFSRTRFRLAARDCAHIVVSK